MVKGRLILAAIKNRLGTWKWILIALLPATIQLVTCIVQASEIPSNQSDSSSLIKEAERASGEGRFSEAIRLYSRAEKDFGPDCRVFGGRGLAHEMLNEDRKAVEDYKLAVRTDPTDYQSMERLAGIYERDGKHAREAIELYKRALDLDPRTDWKEDLAVWIAMLESRLRPSDSSAVGCWHLGNDRARKQDLHGAEELYTRAIGLNPRMFQAYYSRGLIKRKAGEPAPALADFEEAVRLSPEFAQGLMQRGLALEELGKPEQARADFERAAQMDPRDAAVLYNYARTLDFDANQETVLKLYREALRFRPTAEVAAAIQEKLSGLVTSVRLKKKRGEAAYPTMESLW